MLLVAGYIVVVPLIHRDQGAVPLVDYSTIVTEKSFSLTFAFYLAPLARQRLVLARA